MMPLERYTPSKITLTIVLIIFFALTGAPHLLAQKLFHSYNVSHGLPHNTIHCITQDNKGYLWVGTVNGLSRFEGGNFTNYFHNPQDSTSLVSNIVRDVLDVDSGMMVATEYGVDLYSYRDKTFHHCRKRGTLSGGVEAKRFNKIVKTPHYLYLVDNGGNLYRYAGNYILETVNQRGARYDALMWYRDDMLVAVGTKGAYLLSENCEQVIDHFEFEERRSSLVNLYYSKNKNLLYVGYGIGRASRAFRIENRRLIPSNVAVPADLMGTCDYGNNTVFGIDGGGVVFDNGSTITQFTPYNSNISGDAVYSLFVDNDDNLWIGNYRMGLNLYSEQFRWFSVLSRATQQLSYDIVTAVIPHREHLYIGLDGGGFEVYNTNTQKRTVYTQTNSELPGNNVISLVRDRNSIWMAIYAKGVVHYDINTNAFRTYTMPDKDGDTNNVWTLCDDNHGNIWVGGPWVMTLNKSTHQVTPVESLERADCLGLAVQGSYMWVAMRYRGLCKVDIATQKIVKMYAGNQVPEGELTGVYVDRNNRVWVTNDKHAIYYVDESSDRLEQLDVARGVLSGQVMSIEEDSAGNMFMSTDNGLFQYIPASNMFRRMNIEDGLSEFTPHCSASYNGNMYFGTTKGLILFDPLKIGGFNPNYKVQFTQLSVATASGKTVDLYGDAHATDVVLECNENYFTVRFAVPEYVSPDRIRFSCMLEGLESNWRDLDRSRQVSFTNLSPGKYRLKVRCDNADGKWSEPSVLSIEVKSPWYWTAWAKMLYSFIAFAMVFMCIYFYRRHLYVKHQVELSEVEKQSQLKLDEAKMNFYTSITHELRTPVFLIAAQVEEIMGRTLDDGKVPVSYLQPIRRNTLRLNELISRVIDFRKLGAENLSLSVQNADVVKFCQERTISYRDMFQQKGIEYDFEASAHEIFLDFDPLKLELIISNLISNAFKYTKRGGKVTLRVIDQQHQVTFEVQDNGIGIDERVRDTIFESFFRSERGIKEGDGDGLGLSYVKNLVELHNGKISVESEMGVGSKFSFFIPKVAHDSVVSGQTVVNDIAMHKANPAATHRVLIVDDEPETVKLLEHYLERDFKIAKAYNGEDALALALDFMPDLILIDLMMPRMSGLELLTCLKMDKKLQHIKTIVFTAKSSEDDMLAAFDKGADAYLTKPVSLKLLYNRIRSLLSQPTASSSIGAISLATQEEEVEHHKLSVEEQKFILRVREIIDDNLRNPDFNVTFLANQLGMSHSPLYKKLKLLTGMSLIEFVNDYRIYKAVQLFKQGETNVDAVAEAVGINDMKNFRTLFKRKMQVTPKQYIQSQ